MSTDDIRKINDAYDVEGSLSRLGLRPSADKDIQAALVPAGGNWECIAPEGAITRTIIWGRSEVALVNPRGDLLDSTEADIAMGIRATPVMDKALRAISVIASQAERALVQASLTGSIVILDDLGLIAKIARAAIAYVEQPAPRIEELEEEDPDETLDQHYPNEGAF